MFIYIYILYFIYIYIFIYILFIFIYIYIFIYTVVYSIVLHIIQYTEYVYSIYTYQCELGLSCFHGVVPILPEESRGRFFRQHG